jgi:hypothetical protein
MTSSYNRPLIWYQRERPSEFGDYGAIVDGCGVSDCKVWLTPDCSRVNYTNCGEIQTTLWR